METPFAYYTKLVLLVSVGSMQVKALNASSVSVSMIMLYWFQSFLNQIPCTSFVVVQREIGLMLYRMVVGFRCVLVSCDTIAEYLVVMIPVLQFSIVLLNWCFFPIVLTDW